MTAKLRIIGGRYRRRLLELPAGGSVRPMTDRAREALFNIIGPAVQGARVLDLFAGSGALGLEALSRGAAEATFVELDRAAAACLRRNIKQLGLDDIAVVYHADAYRWLGRHASRLAEARTILFVAPPYSHFAERLRQLQHLWEFAAEHVATGSILVVQAPPEFEPQSLPDQFSWDVRTYGYVKLAIGEKAAGR